MTPHPTSRITPALSLADILGEEYAALHPDEPALVDPPRQSFAAEDIADLAGLSHALRDGALHPRVGRNHVAAPSTMLERISAVVVHDQPDLLELLNSAHDSAAHALPFDESQLRRLIAARLTEMLSHDLESDPAFAPIVTDVRAHSPGALASEHRTVRNHALLECAFSAFLITREDRRLAAIIEQVHPKRHAALCLSGGGIRSASFALGVVQGLARRGLLSRFHYMSTVSGGGYTGSWLSAWMARAGVLRVHEELSAGGARGKTEPESAPMRHLRSYSYYLTPTFGLFSADTWTLIATIARNVFLIWLVTLPVLAAALMVPRLLVAFPMTTLADWNALRIDPADVMMVMLVLGTVLAIAALAFVQRHLYTDGGREDTGGSYASVTTAQFITRCFVPLVIAMAALAQAWEMAWSFASFSAANTSANAHVDLTSRSWGQALLSQPANSLNPTLSATLSGVVFWLIVYVAAWGIGSRGRPFRLLSLVLSALSGAIAGAIGAGSSALLFGLTQWKHQPEFFATLAVPISLLGLLVSKHLVVGLASREMTDAEREANARFSAWLLIGIVGWIAAVGIALYGPLLVSTVFEDLYTLAGVSAAIGLLAAIAGTSSTPSAMTAKEPNAGKSPSVIQGLLVALATPLFAALVMVIVSMADDEILTRSCRFLRPWCPNDNTHMLVDLLKNGSATIGLAQSASPQLVIVLGVSLFAVGFALGWRIDTNRFSLHAMYRVRLVRTFLGASRPAGEREPNAFTGFDDTDDMPMSGLWPAADAAKEGHGSDVHPPLHVINLTLNMVAGSKLATQSRMATSFTVTSLHAGSADAGFRRTSARDGSRLYGGRDGISLGTAMAISGAAASPNAGYHSSPAVTFLMTLFNARLGWWLGNPGNAGQKSYADDEPRLALAPILDEMFGRTTDTAPYVYLSDGGHFENLGLYEMVRRRCRFIVVSDAGCDPTASYDDLGAAIRKIRIDFGIPIEFPERIPVYSRDAQPTPGDARYWAIGRIRYSSTDALGTLNNSDDADLDGVLLYIKPAFYGREPYDVFNYGTSTPTFPHESTSNQFFGEAQFESYRMLGLHAVGAMCESEFGLSMGADGTIDSHQFNEWFREHSSATAAQESPAVVSASPLHA